jgi:ATP-dependent helicase HrpB
MKFEKLEEYFLQKLSEALASPNLKQELPLSLDLGGKKPIEIFYSLFEDPYVEAPIQDFYGKSSLPGLMGGKIPLTIKLIGPHRQPIQVTKDLKGFWEKTYKELKKEYAREYPRHYWPDDPLIAKPVLLRRMLPPT